jgi:hypothetical protein
MHTSKILGIIIVLLSVFFLGLQSRGLEEYAFGVKALAMIVLIILYFKRVKKRHPLFVLFLIAFASSEIFNYFTYYMSPVEDESIDIYYLTGNLLYILAYLFLIARILTIMSLKKAILKFPIQILLLFVLGVFVAYMITDISKSEIDAGYMTTVELSYNSVIMFLVCSSLVNYMYNDTKKSMNILVGSICIVFSEVIQIAYYYITDLDITLNVLHSSFLVGAFVFFYLQSRLSEEQDRIYQPQELKT